MRGSVEAGLCSIKVCTMGAFVQDRPELDFGREVLIAVCATTGQGDPPDNARRFFRILKKRKEPCPELRYTILGLGDTNYTKFNAAAKLLDKCLGGLGAVAFHPVALADDGTDLEAVVQPFIRDLPEVHTHIHTLTHTVTQTHTLTHTLRHTLTHTYTYTHT